MAMGRPLTPLELSESGPRAMESMAQSRSLPHGFGAAGRDHPIGRRRLAP